ncbi:hypothetical protein TNCV_3920871 [Trichonephila clavipes]|nr:hypothetical protein TNCV_3920871 [Trichonephila clavipes]
MTIATLKDLIIGSENYDEELTKNIHSTIVEDRKAREENLRIEEQKENYALKSKKKLRIEEREEKLRFEQLRLDEEKRKDGIGPKFPKPRKGSQEKSNTYTNTVNSIVRPGTSYSQAAKASNSTKTQQMAPQVKGNPAALVTNQANLSTLPNPPSINFNNNRTFDMNFITQTLQQTILALSMLTQHIGNAVSIPHPLHL